MTTNKRDTHAAVGQISAFLAAVASLPALLILRGWVLTILWAWFIVPTFHVQPLRIPQALGLSMLIGMFRSYQDDKNKSPWTSLAVAIVSLMFTLLLAWIVRFWM